MTSSLKRLPGNALEITVVIPWSDIKADYDKIFSSLVSEIELPGFRKGKAPKDLAQKYIQKTKVYEEVLKTIVPQIYADVVREQSIHPIITPKIELLEADTDKDWKLIIKTCEKPPIKLGNYRQEVAKLTQDKKTKIWVPGQKDQPKEEELTVSQVLEALYRAVNVELPDILVEQEVNRLLSNLINETQKLGLTVEQYLESQGKTSDQLRNEYREQAQKTLALEFVLEEVAEVEKVTIENQEIDEFIKKAKTDTEKAELERQRYYIGSLLRRQKTLAQLTKPTVTKI